MAATRRPAPICRRVAHRRRRAVCTATVQDDAGVQRYERVLTQIKFEAPDDGPAWDGLYMLGV